MAAKELRRERQQEDEDAFEFDLENPFASPDDEPIARLLVAEAEHSTSVPDAASAARRGAAGFIAKVRGSRAAVVCSALCPFFTCLLFVASSVSWPDRLGSLQVRFGSLLAVPPSVAYLALKIVDPLPFPLVPVQCQDQPWAPRLLAISCLTLAAEGTKSTDLVSQVDD
jgi:cyclin D6, plant